MDKQLYLQDPCGTLSIPYWKWRTIQIPPDVLIMHHNEGKVADGYKVQRFFRIKHDLQNIQEPAVSVELITAEDELADMINLCYDGQGIHVTEKDIQSWRQRRVYRPELWVKIVRDYKIAASGIAEYDSETGEGILEWIQVLPEYQKQGYGQAIVNVLLKSLQPYAKFVTVSGSMENPNEPERLYRKCGFTGEDIWYICTRE